MPQVLAPLVLDISFVFIKIVGFKDISGVFSITSLDIPADDENLPLFSPTSSDIPSFPVGTTSRTRPLIPISKFVSRQTWRELDSFISAPFIAGDHGFFVAPVYDPRSWTFDTFAVHRAAVQAPRAGFRRDPTGAPCLALVSYRCPPL
jgi:hypothetical protein